MKINGQCKAHSLDFCQRAIEAIELEGFKKSEVSELSHTSPNIIDPWLKQPEGSSPWLQNHGTHQNIEGRIEQLIKEAGCQILYLPPHPPASRPEYLYLLLIAKSGCTQLHAHGV